MNKTDREYQIWKRESLGIDLFTETVFKQKPDYINYNPVTAGLCKFPEEYDYSPALFYGKGIDHFNKLTHYMG